MPFLPLVATLSAAPIPGLFNTGVSDAGALLANGVVEPHYRLVQSPDPAAPAPNAYVVNDTLFPIVAGPWLASDPNSKWIGPKADQSVGNLSGDYVYRLTFNLAGLDPTTAVITGRWTSDNAGVNILVNGTGSGISYDGNFGAFSAVWTINAGFVEGTNTLDFVVNNAGATANPTAFRAELSGTAEPPPLPGTPPTITRQPGSLAVSLQDPASFSVSATGARPLFYQWRYNGSPLAGATNAAHSISSVSATSAGGYDVVVSNDSGSVTSVVATLTVRFFPPAQAELEPAGPASRRTGLVISEILYHPKDRSDNRNVEFVEIQNTNPYFEDIGGWRLSGELEFNFPPNTTIPANGFLVVAPSPADVEAVYGLTGVLGGSTNKLSNSGGTIRLRKKSGAVVLEVTYGDGTPWPVAADGAGHSLVLTRPSYGQENPKAWSASAWIGGSPGVADPVPESPQDHVLINEILAHTDLPLLDYVELFNYSPFTVNLSGCYLSDDRGTNLFRIPDGTFLSPRAHLKFDETQLGFALSADGETVHLINAAQNRVLDAVRYGGQANGVASGRHPDGAPNWSPLESRTPGTTNAPARVAAVVINELMFNPLSGDNNDEFVELYNRGTTPVDVGGWRLTEGVSFTIPTGTVIAPGGFLVIAENVTRLLASHPGLNPGLVVGNFNGSLRNAGERVALTEPDVIVSTNGITGGISTNRFDIVVDEVTYAEGGRWGRWTEGGGSSLELIDARSDHRLAPNWAASDETRKASWTVVQQTGVADLGFPSVTADQLQVMLQGPGEVLIDNVEVLVNGANRIPNPGFESGGAGWFFQGTHSKSFVDATEGSDSARSLHLVASERGDHVVNRIRAPLSSPIAANASVTIRADVRWLKGHPEILFRLRGGSLEAVGRLPLPVNLGTPGAPNSRAASNAGPAITDVTHRPVLPLAGQNIRVTARVADPDRVQTVTLRYRIDPSATVNSAPMADDGVGADLMAGDGVYTGVIPGQPDASLVAFSVQAGDAFVPSATSQFPAEAPARECLVRVGETVPAGRFGTYRFWLTKANHDLWGTREKMSNEDLDTTFVYGRSRVVYNVGAHFAGSSYTSPGYSTPTGNLCGYDLNFPEDDSVLGETHFTLDWPIRDATDQREQLMFWFLEQYGLPNLYRRYVHLFVNGVRRGTIYDDVQQPGGDVIEQWYPDDANGSLWKTDCWNEFDDVGNRVDPCVLNSLESFASGGVKKAARYRWNWRPRAVNGTANDFSDLFALVDVMNAPASGYQSSVSGLVDVEHWMRTFAMNDLASFWDAFGNPNAKNTYLYKPQQEGWKLFSWDFDVGIGVFNDATNTALFPALNDPTMTRLYSAPAFVRGYWRALDEAVKTFFQASAVTPLLAAKFSAFQADGINLSSPFAATGSPASAIPDWISARRGYLLSQLATVNAPYAVSTPASIVTGTNLVVITGTAPVSAKDIVINGIDYPVIWTTVSNWSLSIPIASATTNLVVEARDRAGNVLANTSRTIGVAYTGAHEGAETNVVINEIMYNPAVSEATYIELYNRSASYSFDLSGWRLNGADYTFPPGTILTNGGFLVLAKSREAFASAYGAGIPVLGLFDGQLDDGGETLALTRPGPGVSGRTVVDSVTYDDDLPWPVAADGQGAALQLIDPRQDNARVSNWSDGSGWQFFSFTGSVGSSSLTRLSWYFESNGGDVYLDDLSLVPGTQPGVGNNVLVNGGFESGFTSWVRGPLATNSEVVTSVAKSGGSSLHLVVNPGVQALTTFYQDITGVTPSTTYTLSFWYLQGTSGTNLNFRMNSLFRGLMNPSSTRFTPGAMNSSVGTLPPYPALWISEVQPRNVGTLADNQGEFEPWIELYNAGLTPISLDGVYLANNYTNVLSWPFPSGSSINPGEYLLVWADGETLESTASHLHAGFRLPLTNGSVVLSRNVGGAGQILDYLNYAEVAPDQSIGSYPAGGGGGRETFYYSTPRTTNNPAGPPVTLFVNEWLASNAAFRPDPADGDFDDWFEIYNPTDVPVDLSGYRLTDDLLNRNKFIVPVGFMVPARGFLLVWADEEALQSRTNGDLHVNFRLSQSGEAIALFDPAGRAIDSVTFGPQTDNVSQGRYPDGAPGPFVFMTGPTPKAPNVLAVAGPEFTAIEQGPGDTVILTWTSQAGRSYRIQFKTSLTDAAWTDLPGDVAATGSSASRTDSRGDGQRFYRVQLVP